MTGGDSRAAATVTGAPSAGLRSPPGLAKIPEGKKNPGGTPADIPVGRDAVIGGALPQPGNKQSAANRQLKVVMDRGVNTLKTSRVVVYKKHHQLPAQARK